MVYLAFYFNVALVSFLMWLWFQTKLLLFVPPLVHYVNYLNSCYVSKVNRQF